MNQPQSSTRALDLVGLLVLLLVCLLWGGSIPIIRYSEQGIPPLWMATGRVGLAVLLVWLYARALNKPLYLPRQYLPQGLVLGVLFGLTMTLLYLGLVFTDAARGTIFYSTKPFWVALGAHFLISGERLTPMRIMGFAIALLGIYLAFQSHAGAGPLGDWGDLTEIAAGLAFAATALYTKRLGQTSGVGHLQTLFATMLFSLPFMAVAALLVEWGQPFVLSLGVVLSFGYQGLGAQFVAYLLWFWLIHRYAVSQVASFTFLVPLVGVILSSTFLNEPTPANLWMGLALVAAGIVLVNWPGRRPR